MTTAADVQAAQDAVNAISTAWAQWAAGNGGPVNIFATPASWQAELTTAQNTLTAAENALALTPSTPATPTPATLTPATPPDYSLSANDVSSAGSSSIPDWYYGVGALAVVVLILVVWRSTRS